jgi:hypothetical protein
VAQGPTFRNAGKRESPFGSAFGVIIGIYLVWKRGLLQGETFRKQYWKPISFLSLVDKETLSGCCQCTGPIPVTYIYIYIIMNMMYGSFFKMVGDFMWFYIFLFNVKPWMMTPYLITIFQISGFTRIGVVFDRFFPLVPQVTDMGALLPTEGCSQVLDLEKKTDHFLP